jgi:hypothetical protein
MRAMKSLFVFGIVAVLMEGCGSGNSASPSTSYPTNNLYAFMTAVQDESGKVSTTIQLRDGTASTAQYLYLDGGEAFFTSLDIPPQQYLNISGDLFGNSLALSQHVRVAAVRYLYTDYFLFAKTVYGKPEYYSVDTPGSGSSPVRAYVDFSRAGNVMIGASSIDLPPAYQIVAPVSDATFSRATPLTITWTNVDPTATMMFDVAGICAEGSRYNQSHVIGPDTTGSVTLTSADYFPASGISSSINCRVAFILQRVRTGGVSTQFAFGSFNGIQQRTLQLNTTP